MKLRRLGTLAIAATVFLNVSATSVAASNHHEPELASGMGFDQLTFLDNSGNGVADSDGVTSTPWYDTSQVDFSSSEYELKVVAARQWITIKPGGTSVNADADVRRSFVAKPTHAYSALATVQLFDVRDPNNFWARLTIAGNGPSGQVLECNTQVKLSKDLQGVEPPLEQLEIPNCPMQSGVQSVAVKVRAHRGATTSSSGTVIVHEVSFRRLDLEPSISS